jgi:hypothetical protein
VTNPHFAQFESGKLSALRGPWRRGDESCWFFFYAHRMLISHVNVNADPKMDQRMIVASLALKEPSTHAIHEDFAATLGCDAVAYNSVTQRLRKGHLLPSSQGAPSADGRNGIDDADQAVLPVLGKNAFASVRQLSRLTHIPPTTVYYRLKESIWFTARHFRWVPHALSAGQKARRVDLSRQRL